MTQFKVNWLFVGIAICILVAIIIIWLLGGRRHFICSGCGYSLRNIELKCPGCQKDFDLDAIINQLMKDIKSRDMKQSWAAARTISTIGPAAKATVPILIDNLNPQFDDATRNEAANALRQVTGVDYGSDYEKWHRWSQQEH